MITEMVFKIFFVIPSFIIDLLPSVPDVEVGGLAGFLELLAIANQFFPVGELLLYLSVWLALNVLSLFKFFVDWILSLIPLY